MSGQSFAGAKRVDATHAPTAGIFLSYRRGDPGARVGRLYDRLVSRFGKARVFRDIDSALPAANFELVIDHALSASGVLIAVIGPNWQTVTNAQGERRLDNPKDYVRYEIARALENSQCEVLPILHGADTMMPAAEDLPEDLRPMVTLQAIRVDADDEGPHFEFDAQQVVNAIARILGEPAAGLDPDIVLTPPDLVLEPGRSGQIAVVARNLGPTATDVTMSYDGPDWARLAPDAESHAGGRERRYSLIASPPRSADVPPRAWPYTIELRDAHEELPLAQASGTVTTVAFRDAHVHLEPARVETHRSAALSLTVANGGNVHMYGRVSIKADGMNVEGPDRLTLEPGAKQTYPIVVGASARHLVGRAKDRPVVVIVSVDDESDPHVRQTTVSQRPLLRARALVLVTTILVVLLGYGGWRAVEAEAKRIPHVIGLSQAEAIKRLSDAGFEPDEIDLQTAKAEQEDAAGVVVRTEPDVDSAVSQGDSVTIFVVEERPTVAVLPDVTDMTRAEAEQALVAAGFTVAVTEEETTDEGPGEVLRTDPVPETEVSLDQTVTIYVAKAPPEDEEPATGGDTGSENGRGGLTTHTIPEINGHPWAEVEDDFAEHFVPAIEREASNDFPEGVVIRTDPPGGQSRPAGSTVLVVVSSGPASTQIQMPDVVGKDSISAVAILEQAGLFVSIGAEPSCTESPGAVIRQDPPAGKMVAENSTAVIMTAEEPPERCG
jgi:beta-lactam-binding protein with PASTA domain